MLSAVGEFFETDGFMPHGFCLLWKPSVFWLTLASDAAIALAYFTIPAALAYFVWHRRDLQYRWVFYLFVAFILACGTTHLLHIWTLWHPDYGIVALANSATAIISVITAILLWPLMPKVLALPSPSQLAGVNVQLQLEVVERRQAETRVRELNAELEQRVADRTARLSLANEDLLREIAERKKVEAQLVEARDEAVSASQSKSEFLASMSHELRTPLNAILGFSQVISDELLGRIGNGKYTEYARDIHSSGTHLLQIINDLLDISRIEAGRMRLQDENVDVQSIIVDSLGIIAQRAQQESVAVLNLAPANLPSLKADARLLKQVMLNLLSNAVKFTPSGGKVKIDAWQTAEGALEIVVADSGVGIAEDDIPRVLEIFGQVNLTHPRTREGVGLGLPICKSIMGMHDGTLSIESSVGAGTSVTLCFPSVRVGEKHCDSEWAAGA